MAEYQNQTHSSGELTQRFIEFVMMQAQQAALFLGRSPRSAEAQTPVNLEYARLFIDQLEMIREKTKGNLTKEEGEILSKVLSDLQMAFVEVSALEGNLGSAPYPTESTTSTPHEPSSAEGSLPKEAVSSEEKSVAGDASGLASTEKTDETESKKRFTKSYG